MIPPSIVLIIYGLITETSIKALFTASFVPGFMLATFFIIYIIIRTRLKPEDAPLPEPGPDEVESGEKTKLFLTFLGTVFGGLATLLFIRVVFFTVTGQNKVKEGVDLITWGTPDYIYRFGIFMLLVAAFLGFMGLHRVRKCWNMG